MLIRATFGKVANGGIVGFLFVVKAQIVFLG